MTTELVAMLQNSSSSDRTQQNNLNYLSVFWSSNNCSLMKYWNSCFREFSKFTYLR